MIVETKVVAMQLQMKQQQCNGKNLKIQQQKSKSTKIKLQNPFW